MLSTNYQVAEETKSPTSSIYSSTSSSLCWYFMGLRACSLVVHSLVFIVVCIMFPASKWWSWRFVDEMTVTIHSHCLSLLNAINIASQNKTPMQFLPARRYASAVFATAMCLSVRPSVCPSHAGIVPSRAKAGSWNVHHLIAPWL